MLCSNWNGYRPFLMMSGQNCSKADIKACKGIDYDPKAL